MPFDDPLKFALSNLPKVVDAVFVAVCGEAMEVQRVDGVEGVSAVRALDPGGSLDDAKEPRRGRPLPAAPALLLIAGRPAVTVHTQSPRALLV